MRTPASVVISLALAALSAATPAGAAPPQREVRNTLGAMVNVIGLENNLDVVWTWKLSESKNPLLSDAHLALGLTDTLSPAYNRVAAWVELSPLSILDLRAGVEPTVYFGLFNSLQDFASYDAPFDEKTRKDTNSLSYFGTARRLYVAPTVKMRFGRVVAFSGAEVEWWKASGDGPYFYEPARDVLLKSDGDRLVRTSSALLYTQPFSGEKKLMIGPLHQLIDVSGARANRVQRLGVMAVYELGPRWLGLRHATLITQTAYYLDDRFKRHEPWALVALRFHLGRERAQ